MRCLYFSNFLVIYLQYSLRSFYLRSYAYDLLYPTIFILRSFTYDLFPYDRSILGLPLQEKLRGGIKFGEVMTPVTRRLLRRRLYLPICQWVRRDKTRNGPTDHPIGINQVKSGVPATVNVKWLETRIEKKRKVVFLTVLRPFFVFPAKRERF